MMYTIIPLGNPGSEYEYTRHNAARVVMSHIKEDIENLSSCEVFIPDSYMNESGQALASYLKYHEGREIVVVYDDKDLPIGTLRVSYDRSDGGHNGLKNIIDHLGTKEFIRVRIGIAPLSTDGRTEIISGALLQKYVLGRMTEDEKTAYRVLAPKLLACLSDIVTLGYQKAMERNN